MCCANINRCPLLGETTAKAVPQLCATEALTIETGSTISSDGRVM